MTTETAITIFADSSEASTPLLPRLQSAGAHVRVGDLECGSYVISGSIVVLRFTAQEFVEAIIDGMLFHKAGKASMNFERSVFLVEGDIYSTRAAIARDAIDGALSFLVCVEGASILYIRNPIATADSSTGWPSKLKKILVQKCRSRGRKERQAVKKHCLPWKASPALGLALHRRR